MLNKLLSIIVIFFFSSVSSQEKQLVNKEFPVFPICKLVPVKNQSICFDETIAEHIEKYFVFPDSAKELGLQSVVNVFFEIDINGKVDKLFAKSSIVGVEFTDSDALNTANSIFEQAALNIFNKLPVMKPGKIDGVVKSFPCQCYCLYGRGDITIYIGCAVFVLFQEFLDCVSGNNFYFSILIDFEIQGKPPPYTLCTQSSVYSSLTVLVRVG